MVLGLAVLNGDLMAQSNDEFSNPCTISQWLRLNDTEGWMADQLDTFDIGITTTGAMTLVPYTCAWFNDYRGPLVYKLVNGDFVFTSHVSITNHAGTDHPDSTSSFSLGGLMLRAPKTLTNGPAGWIGGMENYIFLSMGYGSYVHGSCFQCPGPHFEVKSTTNSSSSLQISSIDTSAGLIRIARLGNAIIVMYQLPGMPWVVRQRYNRGDFPTTLQAGLVSYTDWEKVSTYSYEFHNAHVLDSSTLNPDPSSGVSFEPVVKATFDYVRFDTVIVPPALQGLNLLNVAQVSDQDLIDWLGYPSTPDTIRIGSIWTGALDSDWSHGSNWLNASLPLATDSIIIQDCSCPLSNCPEISSGTVTTHSLSIEAGGSLTIQAGATLIVTGDNAMESPYFQNLGDLIVAGTLRFQNVTEELINQSNIHVLNSGLLEIEE